MTVGMLLFSRSSSTLISTKQPVGKNDEGLNATVEQHFQVALEAAAIVLHVGEDGKIGGLIERSFNAAKNEGAVGVGHVEDHDSDGVATFAPQRRAKRLGR